MIYNDVHNHCVIFFNRGGKKVFVAIGFLEVLLQPGCDRSDLWFMVHNSELLLFNAVVSAYFT